MREKKNELAGSMDAKKGITAFRLTHFPDPFPPVSPIDPGIPQASRYR
jgi:hypothetical protein